MSPFRVGCVLALAACIAGCATRVPTTSEAAASRRVSLIAPDQSFDVIDIGKSSHAEVIAALGETLVLRFDSGYEVWVYRLGNERTRESGAEFVILFAPTGIVKKTRIRHVPQRG